MYKLSEVGKDDYEVFFQNEGELYELMEELERREKSTSRFVVPGKDLRFVPLLDVGEDHFGPSLYRDTLNRSGLVVYVSGIPKLLAETALFTIKARIEIFGAGLSLLSPETRSTVFNERFRDLNKDVLVVVVDGKVRAVLSTAYGPIPQPVVMKKVMDGLRERLGVLHLSSAVLTYDVLRSYFVLPHHEDVASLYDMEGWTPGIRVSTSDTGAHAVTIVPVIYRNGTVAAIDDGVAVEHRGANTVNKVLGKLSLVFSKFQNVASWLLEAMNIEVHISHFLPILAKEVGLSKKFILEVLKCYNAYSRPEKTTVYTVVEHMFEAAELGNFGNEVEEKVGRLFALSIARVRDLAAKATDEKRAVEEFQQLVLL